jgi:hypothetical protein
MHNDETAPEFQGITLSTVTMYKQNINVQAIETSISFLLIYKMKRELIA